MSRAVVSSIGSSDQSRVKNDNLNIYYHVVYHGDVEPLQWKRIIFLMKCKTD